jgi:hypothetical protein
MVPPFEYHAGDWHPSRFHNIVGTFPLVLWEREGYSCAFGDATVGRVLINTVERLAVLYLHLPSLLTFPCIVVSYCMVVVPKE